MNNKFFHAVLQWIVVLLLGAMPANAQTIAALTVTLPDSIGGIDVPVSVNLDNITFIPDSILSLVEVQGTNLISVPFQIDQGDHRSLQWLIRGNGGERKKIVYELVRKPAETFATIDASIGDSALIIHAGPRNLLRYNYITYYPPKGIDTAYKRSGFIHPLWTPHGQELTRIQVPDHYHHFGIWNPWAHVLYKRDTVDFWNIGDGKGTVRFSKFISVTNGDIFSSFEALHEHVVLRTHGDDEVALRELQTIKVYRPEDNEEYYFADFTFRMNCATEDPVRLLEYRYGGFGWRTTAEWNNTNSEVLTSEGKNRREADGSTARWCIVQGALGNEHGGVVMMSYPSNYNYPEPLRIWPEDQNGRGDMFANFSPTKNRDWLLKPGQTYVLKYRLVVFNGTFTKEQAEQAWRSFVSPPKIAVHVF
jgi:hypothetical protein